MMIVVQLSDPHIVARGKLLRGFIQGVAADAERVMREFDTARYLAKAVAAVNELVPRPDLAVLTGDLVDHGAPEGYEHFVPHRASRTALMIKRRSSIRPVGK
jgi:3',5'-cyclic-AMP phosphodiesterase